MHSQSSRVTQLTAKESTTKSLGKHVDEVLGDFHWNFILIRFLSAEFMEFKSSNIVVKCLW